MTFKGWNFIRSKICLNNKALEQVNKFKYLAYNVSYKGEIDIHAKITNFIIFTVIMSSVLKPNLVQKRTRLGVCNVLAKPTSVYENETWTINQGG
jgi:hypothetical protein